MTEANQPPATGAFASTSRPAYRFYKPYLGHHWRVAARAVLRSLSRKNTAMGCLTEVQELWAAFVATLPPFVAAAGADDLPSICDTEAKLVRLRDCRPAFFEARPRGMFCRSATLCPWCWARSTAQTAKGVIRVARQLRSAAPALLVAKLRQKVPAAEVYRGSVLDAGRPLAGLLRWQVEQRRKIARLKDTRGTLSFGVLVPPTDPAAPGACWTTELRVMAVLPPRTREIDLPPALTTATADWQLYPRLDELIAGNGVARVMRYPAALLRAPLPQLMTTLRDRERGRLLARTGVFRAARRGRP